MNVAYVFFFYLGLSLESQAECLEALWGVTPKKNWFDFFPGFMLHQIRFTNHKSFGWSKPSSGLLSLENSPFPSLLLNHNCWWCSIVTSPCNHHLSFNPITLFCLSKSRKSTSLKNLFLTRFKLNLSTKQSHKGPNFIFLCLTRFRNLTTK